MSTPVRHLTGDRYPFLHFLYRNLLPRSADEQGMEAATSSRFLTFEKIVISQRTTRLGPASQVFIIIEKDRLTIHPTLGEVIGNIWEDNSC